MAKLHSWVFSNSSRCAGVITFSTRSRLCWLVSGVCVIGEILPCTLIDGGIPDVMNRSEAFWCAISLRKEVKSMVLMGGSVGAGNGEWGNGESLKANHDSCSPLRLPAFTIPDSLFPIPAFFRSLEKTLVL